MINHAKGRSAKNDLRTGASTAAVVNITTAKPAGEKAHHDIRPALISIKNTCSYTGLGKTSVYAKIASGELEAIRLGSKTLVTMVSIDALIERAERIGQAA